MPNSNNATQDFDPGKLLYGGFVSVDYMVGSGNEDALTSEKISEIRESMPNYGIVCGVDTTGESGFEVVLGEKDDNGIFNELFETNVLQSRDMDTDKLTILKMPDSVFSGDSNVINVYMASMPYKEEEGRAQQLIFCDQDGNLIGRVSSQHVDIKAEEDVVDFRLGRTTTDQISCLASENRITISDSDMEKALDQFASNLFAFAEDRIQAGIARTNDCTEHINNKETILNRIEYIRGSTAVQLIKPSIQAKGVVDHVKDSVEGRESPDAANRFSNIISDVSRTYDSIGKKVSTHVVAPLFNQIMAVGAYRFRMDVDVVRGFGMALDKKAEYENAGSLDEKKEILSAALTRFSGVIYDFIEMKPSGAEEVFERSAGVVDGEIDRIIEDYNSNHCTDENGVHVKEWEVHRGEDGKIYSYYGFTVDNHMKIYSQMTYMLYPQQSDNNNLIQRHYNSHENFSKYEFKEIASYMPEFGRLPTSYSWTVTYIDENGYQKESETFPNGVSIEDKAREIEANCFRRIENEDGSLQRHAKIGEVEDLRIGISFRELVHAIGSNAHANDLLDIITDYKDTPDGKESPIDGKFDEIRERVGEPIVYEYEDDKPTVEPDSVEAADNREEKRSADKDEDADQKTNDYGGISKEGFKGRVVGSVDVSHDVRISDDKMKEIVESCKKKGGSADEIRDRISNEVVKVESKLNKIKEDIIRVNDRIKNVDYGSSTEGKNTIYQIHNFNRAKLIAEWQKAGGAVGKNEFVTGGVDRVTLFTSVVRIMQTHILETLIISAIANSEALSGLSLDDKEGVDSDKYIRELDLSTPVTDSTEKEDADKEPEFFREGNTDNGDENSVDKKQDAPEKERDGVESHGGDKENPEDVQKNPEDVDGDRTAEDPAQTEQKAEDPTQVNSQTDADEHADEASKDEDQTEQKAEDPTQVSGPTDTDEQAGEASKGEDQIEQKTEDPVQGNGQTDADEQTDEVAGTKQDTEMHEAAETEYAVDISEKKEKDDDAILVAAAEQENIEQVQADTEGDQGIPKEVDETQQEKDETEKNETDENKADENETPVEQQEADFSDLQQEEAEQSLAETTELSKQEEKGAEVDQSNQASPEQSTADEAGDGDVAQEVYRYPVAHTSEEFERYLGITPSTDESQGEDPSSSYEGSAAESLPEDFDVSSLAELMNGNTLQDPEDVYPVKESASVGDVDITREENGETFAADAVTGEDPEMAPLSDVSDQVDQSIDDLEVDLRDDLEALKIDQLKDAYDNADVAPADADYDNSDSYDPETYDAYDADNINNVIDVPGSEDVDGGGFFE